MATAVLSRRERAAVEQIGMLMGIILAIVLALAVYFVVLPMFSRAGAAAISLSASGTAAPDGSSAVMTLVIQNTGSSPAAVYAIHLTPYGVASVAGASPSSFAYSGTTRVVSIGAATPTGAPAPAAASTL